MRGHSSQGSQKGKQAQRLSHHTAACRATLPSMFRRSRARHSAKNVAQREPSESHPQLGDTTSGILRRRSRDKSLSIPSYDVGANVASVKEGPTSFTVRPHRPLLIAPKVPRIWFLTHPADQHQGTEHTTAWHASNPPPSPHFYPPEDRHYPVASVHPASRAEAQVESDPGKSAARVGWQVRYP